LRPLQPQLVGCILYDSGSWRSGWPAGGHNRSPECSPTFDTVLWLYEGACDNLTCLRSEDDNLASRGSLLTYPLAFGSDTTLTVAVLGYDTAEGEFSILLQSLPSASSSQTPSVSSSFSRTPSFSPSVSLTPSGSPSDSLTQTVSASPSCTISSSPTLSRSLSLSESPSMTGTESMTESVPPSLFVPPPSSTGSPLESGVIPFSDSPSSSLFFEPSSSAQMSASESERMLQSSTPSASSLPELSAVLASSPPSESETLSQSPILPSTAASETTTKISSPSPSMTLNLLLGDLAAECADCEFSRVTIDQAVYRLSRGDRKDGDSARS
jgi:hypothetical protein